MEKIFQTELAGRPFIVETGRIAQFANGSCLIRYGETVILSTITASPEPRQGVDYFPLSVDYEEKMYSVGKFPGGFIKREGRPTEKAILTSRVIDRPLRPLFPKDLRNSVAVNNLVLSVDQDCSPEIAAMIGTSIATCISDIPFNGPIAGVHVGLVDGEIVINPDEKQRETSEMTITLAGTSKKVCMIEANANEVPDDKVFEGIVEGHKVIQELCTFINSIVAEIGKEKFAYESNKLPEAVTEATKAFAYDTMRKAVLAADKSERDAAVSELLNETKAHLVSIDPEWEAYTADAIDQLEKFVVREYLLNEQRRVDGRRLDEIRPLSADVGLLPRVHGTGLFQRGQTQVLTTCTLGPLSKIQKLDGLDNEDEKRYMHHYNMPGYSTGEAKFARSPGRREIGHGALAERSLVPVLPSEDDFPYAIRCVSEVTMSNGSTSQGSVCARTLTLMDAGVPIKRPVAGISAGLIVKDAEADDYMVFMDIQGIEDFFGDMDFKVAGTTEGITSIQVDIKVDGLSHGIIRDALAMTRKGRLQIIEDVITPCISEPRQELSPYAPKIIQTVIPVDKIREVIGAGGKVINRIIEETGVEIDIEDDGRVFVASPNSAAADKALKMIEGIAHDPAVGQEFEGVVTRLMNFGAFVEFLPGKEGLVHISKLAWRRVERVEDVVKEGDTVKVKVLEIDSQGRINLSIRDTQQKPEGFEDRRSECLNDRCSVDRRRGGRKPRSHDRNSGPERQERSNAPERNRPVQRERDDNGSSGRRNERHF